LYQKGIREECRLRVFENRIPRGIFIPKRDEKREWRRLHSEELHSLYSSPNIVRVIKSRRLRWAGHRTKKTLTERLPNTIESNRQELKDNSILLN
jgi:hypothetical protein